jgi:hypothetical protein
MFIEHPGMKAGVFGTGKGIGKAADHIELKSDLVAVPASGSLEDHVFDKVRDAVFLHGLVPRARTDPNTERDGPEMVQSLGNDPDSILENTFFMHC